MSVPELFLFDSKLVDKSLLFISGASVHEIRLRLVRLSSTSSFCVNHRYIPCNTASVDVTRIS